MRNIIYVFLLFPLSAFSYFNNYTSINNINLPYYVIPSTDHHENIFVYLEGDGDICEVLEDGSNFMDYNKRLKRWKKNASVLSPVGTWIYPKIYYHHFCEQNQHLDGVGFKYRTKETSLLISKIEKDFPHVKNIYLFGFSAGPIVGAEVLKVSKSPKIKGLIIGGISSNSFRQYLPSFMMRLGLEINIPQDIINQSIRRTQNLFDQTLKECSPNKKTMVGAFQFIGDPDPSQNIIDATRTDNHYCEYTNTHFSKTITELPNHFKFFVFQGETDPVHTVNAAHDTYNLLLSSGKKSHFHIMKGIGHNYREDELVEQIRIWLNL